MSEWWTYRLHDFLMFSPRAYSRMFELYNEAIWPINALAAMIAFALLFVAARLRFALHKTATRDAHDSSNANVWQRTLQVAIFAYFAVAHAWIALVFMREHYAPIFLAAEYFAVAFFVQAAMFAFAAGLAARSHDAFRFTHSTLVAALAISIVSLALIVHPTILLALQSNWSTLEGVGVAPDPTAIAALGFLLLIRSIDATSGSARIARYLWRALLVIAILWCVVSLLTLVAMRSYLVLIPAVALFELTISTFFQAPIESGQKSVNPLS
jgi:hypothetical protein